MASEKDAERQEEETPETPEETPKEETPKDESTETSGEVKESNSLTGVLNAKIAALAIVGIVVGILIGQVALPVLGVGLVALEAEGNGGSGAVAVDEAEIEASVSAYLKENFDPQGIEVEVKSFEEFNDKLYVAGFELTMDGQIQVGEVYVTKDGSTMIAGQVFLLNEPVPQVPNQPNQSVQPTEPTGAPTVGTFETFNDSGYEVELQDGKPIIRLFTTTWCPHCTWVKETFDAVVNEYVAEGKIVAYHWEVDTGDNTLTSEVETLPIPASETAVYEHFNPRGSIPTFVFGGKYHRVGNGFEQQDDLVAEANAFRAVIEALIAEANQ